MTPLTWDEVGESLYETGVDHGVLYLPDEAGVYNDGFRVEWSHHRHRVAFWCRVLLRSTRTTSSTSIWSPPRSSAAPIEAFTYPEEFGQCDGTALPARVSPLVSRVARCSACATGPRSATTSTERDHGYKLHLIYGALAAPSEKAYATINDSPEAIAFSWEITTTPVPVTDHKPTALIVVDSTVVDPADLAALEDLLYGKAAHRGSSSDAGRCHRSVRQLRNL